MTYITIIIICTIGTLLHFVYEWSHHNKCIAVFAAVNESTWEHIKIAMTPTLLWSIYEIIEYGFTANYLLAKSLCLLTIILVIPILFYSYTAFTKKSLLPIDVVCFFITITCSQLVFNYFINLNALPVFNNIPALYLYLSIVLLLIELVCYFTFTFKPFKNFIFEDPITHKYGLDGHPCHHHHHHEHGGK